MDTPYTDNALPTCGSLTTSAPSVIARMIFQSGVSKGEQLLEIGTGTGYQAAVLAEMGVKVYTIEIDGSAVQTAGRILVRLGYKMDKRLKDARGASLADCKGSCGGCYNTADKRKG